jgi:hypothetical protein
VTVIVDRPPGSGSAGASTAPWSRRISPLAAAFLAVLLVAVMIAGWRVGILLRTIESRHGPRDASSAARSTREAASLMNDLVSSRATAHRALNAVVAARDIRFVAVLIELMRASQIRILTTADDAHVTGALEMLTGKRFGADWPAWAEWYGTTSLVPPHGFTGWKGRLLGRIDPRFREFLSDSAPSRIRVEEIQWGGAAVNGIPALTKPRMIPAVLATDLVVGEPVFGLAFNGYARAYPLKFLDRHDIVNDRVGGVPVSVAYCTLCGAGIAYNGRASNGIIYTFGSSGLLYRSNKLMYDHQTGTLWNQLTGEPILGKLAGTKVRLTLRPVVLTSWREWLAEHPESKVLDVAGYERTLVLGTPHGQYVAAPRAMIPVWRRSRVLPSRAHIFALRIDGVPKAFPVDALVTRRVVNDVIGRTPVVLIATHGTVAVNGRRDSGPVAPGNARAVPASPGAEVRAYRGTERFRPGPDVDVVLDGSGHLWRVTEDALIGPGGVRASRVPGFLAYWFAWYAFFPHTLVYTP